MRWSAQQVLDDGVGSELALPGLRGLLRTVRVPEFAGVTFHEVEAKSALNRVPGDSPVPFRWTVNPYRGCGHACVYCLDGATARAARRRSHPAHRRSAARGRRAGHGGGRRGVRRYVPTPVLAHWSTTKPAHRVTLADGTTLVASGEHRFLTRRGWRHVAPGWCRAGRRRRLRRGDVLLGPGALPAPRVPTPRPTGRATCTAWSVRTRPGACGSATAGSTRPSRRSAWSWRRSAGPTTSSPSRRPITCRPRAGAPAGTQPPARRGAPLAARLVRVGGCRAGRSRGAEPSGLPGRGHLHRLGPGRGRSRGVRRNRTTTGAPGSSGAWRTPR